MPAMRQFVRGEFVTLVATRPFSFGDPAVSITKGAVVLYDGSVAQYGGQNHPAPRLIGAYRAEWLVEPENYDEHAPVGRVSANIQVRHATQGGNPMMPESQQRVALSTTEQDERYVGDVKSHAQAAKDRNATPRGNSPPSMNQPGMRVSSIDQDGVPVRTLKTASGQAALNQRTTLSGDTAGSALRDAERSGVIEPGRGLTENEYLARLDPDERAKYVAEKEARSAAHAPRAPRAVVNASVVPVDLSALRPATTTHESEGITFTSTNGSKRDAQPSARAVVVSPAGEDVRRRVAKAMCPDFPDLYDFTQPLKKKIARLHADFDDRPDVIRAVYAAESDEVKEALVTEFSEVFSG